MRNALDCIMIILFHNVDYLLSANPTSCFWRVFSAYYYVLLTRILHALPFFFPLLVTCCGSMPLAFGREYPRPLAQCPSLVVLSPWLCPGPSGKLEKKNRENRRHKCMLLQM